MAAVTIFAAAVVYFTVAHTAHWPPFGPSHSQSPTVIPSRATTSTASSADGVPADYQGTWEGNISGPAGLFETTINLNQGTAGAQVGVFQNESSGCRGAIYLERGGGPISLRIVTKSNPHHDCALLAYAQATRASDGLHFSFEQTATGPADRGTLTSVPATTHPPQ